MIIRKATLKDAKAIAAAMLLAMEELVYKFIGEDDPAKAETFLLDLAGMENNQYSYRNCWVVETDGEVVAAAVLYDGAKLAELRAPVAQYIQSKFNKAFDVENETQAGEYYIDCIGVSPGQQGKGIGSKLLQFLIDEYVNKQQQTLGLLVDITNPNAKKLYLKLGFKVVGEKTLAGKRLEHLQIAAQLPGA